MGKGIREPLRGREQGKGREVERVRGNIGGTGMRERGRRRVHRGEREIASEGERE